MSVDTIRRAGELLCIWNPDVFQLKASCCNQNFLLLSDTIFHSFECVIINVYGPNEVAKRREVWECLIRLKSIFLGLWCLGGDFNEIRTISERIGCFRRYRGMRDFNYMIAQLELMDMPMLGRKFTWCNSQDREKWSRLDRFLLNHDWVQTFNFKLWGLPRLLFDHCPIILMEDGRDWGPRPFRFINAWLLHLNFLPFVKQTWSELMVEGWAGFKCLMKFKALKQALKQWNMEVFGKIEAKLKIVEDEAHALDLLAEERPLLAPEQGRRKDVRSEVWRLSKMLKWTWLQKSRSNWASKEFWSHRPKLSGPFKNIGGAQVVEQLEAVFTEEAIREVLNSCEGNKAPGPNGFNMSFFKKCWGIVKYDVLQFMREFHQNASLVRGLNSSFIALIPKSDSPSGLNEYRPISLIGSLYKILAKVLANRIKLVMPRIISDVQSAFLGGRHILDGVLIANEAWQLSIDWLAAFTGIWILAMWWKVAASYMVGKP
ncbi:uncharacterized protein LOC114284188 [Camellia sinensis]|uniref:uncharacterized protein LOC114284188 n=1 Tax=Camellia sinensis TaxID=4442 RepID=UPI001035F84A|nr:uncharacterized protein LOC114284188 [Camellia sinensis]